MIAINSTLLFQMVHFLIAYFLLRSFLFEPIVAIVHAQEKVMHDLSTRIDQAERTLHQAQREQTSMWQKWRGYFMRNTPAIDRSSLLKHGQMPSITPLPFDLPHIKKEQKNLEQAIFTTATQERND